MSDSEIGDLVYRRTINDHVLSPWIIVAERGKWWWKEYYLKTPHDKPSLIVIENGRDLFKVPPSGVRRVAE